ncbi:MAG: SDR family NAD(P)-dependent oxidoreductase [bacterium]
MSTLLDSYWRGKAVLITGASSGLGAAITEALAPFQVKFGLLSRREEKMQELADRLAGSSIFWMRSCDVRNRDDVFAAVRSFQQAAGRIDAAWINSGIGGDTSFRRWKWESFDNMMHTNLHGAIYTTIACLEIMVPQKSGTIIGIGSAASMRGMGSRSVYSLTKIGLHYFLESMAVELPEIQFTIFHPGFVDTPINQGNPNRFWLMQPPQAAQLMIKAVAKRKRVVIYPLPMKILYRCAQIVPARLFRHIAHRAIRLSQPGKAS